MTRPVMTPAIFGLLLTAMLAGGMHRGSGWHHRDRRRGWYPCSGLSSDFAQTRIGLQQSGHRLCLRPMPGRWLPGGRLCWRRVDRRSLLQ